MRTSTLWTSLARAPRAVRVPSTRAGIRLASTDAASSSRSSRLTFGRAVSTLTLGVTCYSIGAFYPPELLTFIFPRAAPAPPSAQSKEGIAHTAQVEYDLQNLNEITEMRSKVLAGEWYETRPYESIPEEKIVNSLTAGALRGPGKLAVPPILFAKRDESETIAFIHVGRGVCGHDGIVHGGLLATLMDESLARIAIINLPNKIGVTAKLELNYRAPTKANQILRIRTSISEKRGRKMYVRGQLEDLDGKVLVEANALFVEPKHAYILKPSWVEAALGMPKPPPSTPTSPTSA